MLQFMIHLSLNSTLFLKQLLEHVFPFFYQMNKTGAKVV